MATAPGQTKRTRILIISDTHNATPFDESNCEYAFRWPLAEADVLLHAGDLTTTGKLSQHEKTVEMIKKAPAKLKIVIPGNHDLTLDREYYPKNWREHGSHDGHQDTNTCRALYTNQQAEEAGIVYIEEGIRTFTLANGCKFTVYASAYTPAFWNWAFAYGRDEDRFNPGKTGAKFKAINPVPDHGAIDIMLTHGPPYGVLDETIYGQEKVGCAHLLTAVSRCKPRLHVFGHIHEAWGAMRMNWDRNSRDGLQIKNAEADRSGAAFADISSVGGKPLVWGKETLFVNAAIMDVHYEPRNAPWIVDLDLPLAAH